MKQHHRLKLVMKHSDSNYIRNAINNIRSKNSMTAKKTATPKVEKLTSKFRVVIPGIVDFDSDNYDFFVDEDGEVRLDDTWFAGTDQAVQALRAMADFLESYKSKATGK